MERKGTLPVENVHSSIAVSYTHLDVYKRQLIDKSQHPILGVLSVLNVFYLPDIVY